MIEWGILKILIKFIEENKKAFVFIKYGLLKLFMVGYSVGFSCFFLELV
ncbi:branched-chain amino acid aminotransferase I [Helicobacter pylori CPY6081]|nr:branched-chain amino acid aminotransferase I [Helicobacter pylori CPY6081]